MSACSNPPTGPNEGRRRGTARRRGCLRSPSGAGRARPGPDSIGGRERLGLLLGPAVVGLAVRQARDLGDEDQLARNLVARDAGPAMFLQLLERRLLALARLQQRGDPLAPT